MRKAVLTLLVILAGAAAAFAGNCTMTTYNVYIAHGFSCGIGTDTFSGFGYVGTFNPPGSGIPASSIMVTPITTPGNPGAPVCCALVGLKYLRSSRTGFLISVRGQGKCGRQPAHRSHPVDRRSVLHRNRRGHRDRNRLPRRDAANMHRWGDQDPLTVFDDARGSQLVDTISFAGVSEISVSKDLTLSAGTAGSASLASVTDQYTEGLSTVPEPGTLSTIGLGAAALAGFARRKLGL